VFLAIARSIGPCGYAGTLPPKATWSRLEPRPRGRLARLSDRTGAEDPERPLRKLVRVVAQEVLRVALPALHVDRTAQHNCVVAVKAVHLSDRPAIDVQPGFA
jgi:hypothetical protein